MKSKQFITKFGFAFCGLFAGLVATPVTAAGNEYYVYDGSGNIVAKQVRESSSVMAFGEDNHLVSADSAAVSEGEATTLVYNHQNIPVGKKANSGISQWAWDDTKMCLFEDEVRTAELEVLDYLGSSLQVGASPYGENLSQGRYTGKFYDADLEAFVFPYRNYSPTHNRWTTLDPSGFPDGTNRFAYTADPLTRVDPLGLATKIAGEDYDFTAPGGGVTCGDTMTCDDSGLGGSGWAKKGLKKKATLGTISLGILNSGQDNIKFGSNAAPSGTNTAQNTKIELDWAKGTSDGPEIDCSPTFTVSLKGQSLLESALGALEASGDVEYDDDAGEWVPSASVGFDVGDFINNTTSGDWEPIFANQPTSDYQWEKD